MLDTDLADFRAALQSENHTLKRSLTDPHLFSGIGNAYSDEILHRARLSPIAMSMKLSPEEVARLFDATQESWIVLETVFERAVFHFRGWIFLHSGYPNRASHD